MATSELTTPDSPSNIFHRYVLTNLQYWQDYVTVKLKDTAALDRDQNRIVRAISFALDLDEAWPTIGELIEAFSAYMERRGYWEAWQWVLTQALEVTQRSNDMAGVVRLSALLARLALRQSRFKEVVAYHRYTIRIARRMEDCYNEARACSNLGYFYVEKGLWHRAEVLCCHALAIFEQLNSNHGRAHTENHLGTLYIWQGHWELAQQHLERACEIWQGMGDNHGLLYGLINLGSLYDDMEHPDEALSCLEKALYLAKLTGEETQIANIYLNMGIAYRLKEELEQAEAYLWQGEAIFRRFANSVGLVQVQDNLGLIRLKQRKWSEVKSYLSSALTAWDDLGNDCGKIRTLTYMVEYELARGSRRQAARRLAEIERLMDLSNQYKQSSHWQSLLAKYRRSLGDR